MNESQKGDFELEFRHKKYILNHSVYMMFWNRQVNCGDRNHWLLAGAGPLGND